MFYFCLFSQYFVHFIFCICHSSVARLPHPAIPPRLIAAAGHGGLDCRCERCACNAVTGKYIPSALLLKRMCVCVCVCLRIMIASSTGTPFFFPPAHSSSNHRLYSHPPLQMPMWRWRTRRSFSWRIWMCAPRTRLWHDDGMVVA